MAKGSDLIAELREDAGKGASRRLRRAGKVPAIMYGGGEPPQRLALDRNHLMRQMEREAFFSSVLNVNLNGSETQAILKDVQAHPAKRAVLHVDLQRIVATEKIRMTVPIHFLNEDTAIGVKLGGGTVAHMMSDVEITCLPKDLPEYLDLDIGQLELDQMLYLSDVKLPDGVEFAEREQDQPVVSIHIVKVIEEVVEAEEVEVEPGEVPVAGEAEEPEGEAEGEGD